MRALSSPGEHERRLTGGPLIKHMLSNIDEVLSGKGREEYTCNTAERKLVLYSAHDTTVAAFLEALKVGAERSWSCFTAMRNMPCVPHPSPHPQSNHFRARSPPYASTAILELYTDSDGSNAAVEVHYKNESALYAADHPGHVLLVPGCSSTRCPLAEFKAAVASILPGDDFTKVGGGRGKKAQEGRCGLRHKQAPVPSSSPHTRTHHARRRSAPSSGAPKRQPGWGLLSR